MKELDAKMRKKFKVECQKPQKSFFVNYPYPMENFFEPLKIEKFGYLSVRMNLNEFFPLSLLIFFRIGKFGDYNKKECGLEVKKLVVEDSGTWECKVDCIITF